MNEIESSDQWYADTHRMLKLGFLEHDPEVVAMGMDRLSLVFGKEAAERMVLHFITHLMNTEDFSFFNEETGDASPLL